MKEIDESFYELISKSDDAISHPYDVEWAQYDALQPNTLEVTKYE